MNAVLKTLPPPQTTNHRQNRRRERPGARTRRTLSRKNAILYDCTEGLLDARDSSVPLPSDRSRPSPLLRQSFDQSWARWKAREAEAAAIAAAAKAQAHQKEMDMLQQEQQRLRALFGGDEVDDDELRRLGILHDSEIRETNDVAEDLPLYPSAAPAFIIRPGKPSRKRALKRSTWQSLSLYLSFSELSGDNDIVRLLTSEFDDASASIVSSTIQHRETRHLPTSTISLSCFDSVDTPLSSLPITELPLEELPVTESAVTEPESHSVNSSFLLPDPSADTVSEDWAFIGTPTSTTTTTSEVEADVSNVDISEAEAWVLLNDDS